MRRINLDSSALVWVRYLARQHVLQIGLRNRRVYDYLDVPEQVYRELLAAQSKGRYYNSHIRNDFPCQEIRRQRARNA